MTRKLKLSVMLSCLACIVVLIAYYMQSPKKDQETDGLLLIDHDGRNQLHLAVLFGCGDFKATETYQLVEAVQQAINIVKDVNLRDKLGNTPLHYACRREVMSLLLKNKADPRLKNKKGQTVLMHWIIQAFEDYREGKLDNMLAEPVLREAIDNGLIINAQDKTGKTALHYLIEGMTTIGGEEVLKHKATLVLLGADPNILDFKGEAPSLEKEPGSDF